MRLALWVTKADFQLIAARARLAHTSPQRAAADLLACSLAELRTPLKRRITPADIAERSDRTVWPKPDWW
jgi:hypothetical protein